MIIVRKVLTADNTDVLNGTDLENIPGEATLAIAAASTQSDTEMTITGRGFEIPARALPIRKTSTGEPDVDQDPIFIRAPGGGKLVIDINVVTAATVVVEVVLF